jgi:hypothetical protein
LAQWLTSPNNPLTPRVIVNRVWAHLFGHGIVSTVDNFGFMGDRPSNPELLDHLTSEFIRNDWSIKKLIRTIVLTHAYRLGPDAPANYLDVDPANRLVWRHSPRRLDAEEIRDAMLASSGRLELKPPCGSPVRQLKMIEILDNGPEARSMTQAADRSVYRSVYLPLLRGITPRTLEAFDPVNQTLVTGQRESTTVPTQALYLLNSNFVRQQSLFLAGRLLAESDRSSAARIRQLYQLILNRPPNQQEIARATRFLSSYSESYAAVSARPSKLAKPVLKKPAAVKQAPDLANADDVEHAGQAIEEQTVKPKTRQEAAWMSLVQALYGSAEFRFVR